MEVISTEGWDGEIDVDGFDNWCALVIKTGYHKKSRNGYHARWCTGGLSDSDEEGPK